MRQIKIFLYKTPANQPQDSIWESLKDPINVIWKMILVLIAISPIFGIYSILSYLGDYKAKIIGFSLFSNISNLWAVLFYSYSIFGLFIFVIFILPFFLGYYYGGVLISERIIGCENYRNYFKKIYFDNGKKNLLYILLFALLIFGLFYLYKHGIFLKYTELALYISIGYSIFILLQPEKLLDKFLGILILSLSSTFSLLLLVIISILPHKDIILLAINNLFYTNLLFIYGLVLSNAKKANLIKDFGSKYKIIAFVLVASFIIADLSFLKFPFPKINIEYSGLGNKEVIFKLRPNTPLYLINQLISKPIPVQTKRMPVQTQKLFLLIQTYNNYYVEKYLNPNPTIKIFKGFIIQNKDKSYSIIIPKSYIIKNKKGYATVKIPIGYTTKNQNMPQNMPQSYLIKYRSYDTMRIPKKYVTKNKNKHYYTITIPITYLVKKNIIKLPKKYVTNIITKSPIIKK